MNRRKLLTFIGLAPFVPVAVKAVEPERQIGSLFNEPASAAPRAINWVKPKGCITTEWISCGGGPGLYETAPNSMRGMMALVCENHHDKAWPEECSCGPGMRYGDTLKA